MGEDDKQQKDRRFATTLARGLSVLRVFRATDDGLGNSDIAERTGLPKSTVSRLTFTLQSLGYLTNQGRGDRYRPGPALMALGNLANASMSYVDFAEPILQRLANETGTLSVLAVRDDRKMLLVRTWRPADRSSLWLEAGQRVPFNGSSSGNALLGALSTQRFEELARQVQDDPDMTPERAAQIRQDAAGQLSSRGFVIADPAAYFTPNIHAVSVPFQPGDMDEPVIFSCGAEPRDLPLPRLEQIVGPALRQSVDELQRVMGLRPAIQNTGTR